jgi:hypothetical protein
MPGFDGTGPGGQGARTGGGWGRCAPSPGEPYPVRGIGQGGLPWGGGRGRCWGGGRWGGGGRFAGRGWWRGNRLVGRPDQAETPTTREGPVSESKE